MFKAHINQTVIQEFNYTKSIGKWNSKMTGCPGNLDLQEERKGKYKRLKDVEVARQCQEVSKC